MFQIKKLDDSSWTTLPEPAKEGITITDEPIWAGNTGRNCNGKMIGDIVAWKTTVNVKWASLSFANAKTIRDKIVGAGPFFKIKYYDFSTSTLTEKTVYCSNIPRLMYSLAKPKFLGVEVTFIEQ